MMNNYRIAGCILAITGATLAHGEPIKTELKQTGTGWQLLRDGKPYFIKGAGGNWSRPALAAAGGNSFRTWGVGKNTTSELDEAQKNGLSVSLGFWVGHKKDGFKADAPATVSRQLEQFKEAVRAHKDHPAVLVWAIGNEMEIGNDTPALWESIENMAKAAHEIDPNHPTMTVVAELGGNKVANIHKYCPSVDIVGINSYAGGVSVGPRYQKYGGTKPYIITEFGPPGQWETGKTKFGAVTELTSTEKAKWYWNTYEKSVLGMPGLCLGSYAFTWGFKVEATSTWYGMFIPDGGKLAAVDTMQELWTGKVPERPCPVISKFGLLTPNEVKAGEIVKAAVEVSDPNGDKLKYEWTLHSEFHSYGVQGGNAKAAPSYPDAIVKSEEPEAAFKMPEAKGVYRIYCYVRNQHGGAALGSLPVCVTAGN